MKPVRWFIRQASGRNREMQPAQSRLKWEFVTVNPNGHLSPSLFKPGQVLWVAGGSWTIVSFGDEEDVSLSTACCS